MPARQHEHPPEGDRRSRASPFPIPASEFTNGPLAQDVLAAEERGERALDQGALRQVGAADWRQRIGLTPPAAPSGRIFVTTGSSSRPTRSARTCPEELGWAATLARGGQIVRI